MFLPDLQQALEIFAYLPRRLSGIVPSSGALLLSQQDDCELHKELLTFGLQVLYTAFPFFTLPKKGDFHMSLIIFPNRNQSSNVQNVYNYNNSKVINAENVTDNSITNFYQFPPELFEQKRTLIEETNSSYKEQLLDILTKIGRKAPDFSHGDIRPSYILFFVLYYLYSTCIIHS